MVRQPVGVRVQRRVAQLAVRAHHRHRVRRRRRLRREQLRQRRARHRCAVAFQPAQDACRAPPASGSSSAPSGRVRRRDRRLQQPDQPRRQRLHAGCGRTGRWRIPARRRCRPARRPAAASRPARATGRTSRSRRRPARTAPQGPAAPARRRRVVLERQHHLEQRMPRQRPRRVEHLDQPLERHVLVARRPQDCRRAPGRPARAKLGSPRHVGAQHQRVDEEADQVVQRRVGAARDRRCRSGCRRRRRAASAAPQAPACSTMNRLARLSRARPTSAAVQLGAAAPPARWPPRWLDTAGRGRSAGSSSCSGRPPAARASTRAAAPARCPDRSHRPAPRAATACSRRTAPAAAPSRRPLRRAPRRVEAAQVAPQRRRATSRRRRCGAAAAAARARVADSA